MKTYWTSMILGGLLALSPGAQFAIAILSGGILFPVLFLPTAAYYGISLLPFTIPGRTVIPVAYRAITAAGLLVTLLFWPGHGPKKEFEETQLNAKNLYDLVETSVGVLVEVWKIEPNHRKCGSFCLALLASPRVTFVSYASRSDKFDRILRFRKLSPQECSAFKQQRVDQLKRLDGVFDGGDCLLREDTNDRSASIRLKIDISPGLENPPSGEDKLTIEVLTPSGWSTVAQDITGRVKKVSFPPWLTFEMSAGTPQGGTVFASKARTKSDVYLKELFSVSELSLRTLPNRTVNLAGNTRELTRSAMKSQMFKEPSRKFNASRDPLFEQFLASLLVGAKWQTSPEDRAFLLDGIRSGTLEIDYNLINVIASSRGLLKEVLPQVVAAYGSKCEGVGWALTLLNSDDLAPFAEVIRTTGNSNCHQEVTLKLAGKLGVSPVERFTQAMQVSDLYHRGLAIEGMCKSDKRWRNDLIPILVKQLPQDCILPAISTREASNLYGVIATLDNFGAYSKVEQWLLSCSAYDMSRYSTRTGKQNCR